MNWAACVDSGKNQVAGSYSWTDVTAASGSTIGVGSSIWSVAGAGTGAGTVCGRGFWVCISHGANVLLLSCLSDGQKGTGVQEHPLHIIQICPLRTISWTSCWGRCKRKHRGSDQVNRSGTPDLKNPLCGPWGSCPLVRGGDTLLVKFFAFKSFLLGQLFCHI